MGISGLLPVFKSITKPVHIREYSGKKAAVDIYSWLHKGAFGCSKDLIDGTPTDRSVLTQNSSFDIQISASSINPSPLS